ncbi:MAG: hypothetical protein QNJ12_00410 [Ilumatobacter sp.]|uniref:SGNH/GDSL hydrolase family protein n=1 Tax=Ilumatobacter sp. TaxID=1967498 RepID=UPI00261696C1|nr:hypothetical protein [Ilumatobacter sp.]MDJ0767213.1 hypothetical protein [Ilumatobacter sp.]
MPPRLDPRALVGVVAVLTAGACGADGTSAPSVPVTVASASPSAAPTVVATSEGDGATASPATASTGANTTRPTVAPPTSAPTTVDETVAPLESAPTAVDVGDRTILVFGNSVDASAGHGDEFRALAWPTQLQERLEARDDLVNVTVVNEAQPGATVTADSQWGYSANLRLITYVPEVMPRYSDEQRAAMIAIVAPSVIDLQFNGADADATAAGVGDVVALLDDAGVGTVVVLPMNPVSQSIDDIVDLNDSVAEVNRLLDEAGLLATQTARSPLMVDGSSDGDRRFYDDYPGRDTEGNPVGADGLHVDEEGHRVLAAAIEPTIAPLLTELPEAAARP